MRGGTASHFSFLSSERKSERCGPNQADPLTSLGCFLATCAAQCPPKFPPIWGGEVASRAVSLCQKEWSSTALNGVSGLGSTLPSSLIDPYEWKERYSGVTYHELSFRRRTTIKHLFRC